jgi:ribosome modulation factor
MRRLLGFRTSRVFDAVFLLVLAVLLAWSWFNRVTLGDAVFFWRYEPSAKVVRVAEAAGLSEEGRKLLYRTDPAFLSKAEIQAECDIERLGCINGRGQVFILEEDDEHSSDDVIVTAVHEMLHLAYRRLSNERKQELAPLLDEAVRQNWLNGLQEELKDETTDEDRRDEAHSLLGTEYGHLPAGLEEYYKQYFDDRSRVVAAQERSGR